MSNSSMYPNISREKDFSLTFPARSPPRRPSTEWSEFFKLGMCEEDVGPLDAPYAGSRRSSRLSINAGIENQEDWRTLLGDYDFNGQAPNSQSAFRLTPGGRLVLPSSSTFQLPSATALNLTLPPLLSIQSQTTSFDPLTPPSSASSEPKLEALSKRLSSEYSSSTTALAYQPLSPNSITPPLSESSEARTDSPPSLVAPAIKPEILISRRISISDRVTRGGGAATWLGMAAEPRDHHIDEDVIKPTVKVKAKRVRKEQDYDGPAAVAARTTSTARKLARKPEGYTPRPPNAWILYRSEQIRLLKQDREVSKKPQSDISKLIGYMWREEPPSVKKLYELQAEAAKLEHAVKYPNYRFKPVRRMAKQSSVDLESSSNHLLASPSNRSMSGTPRRSRAFSTNHSSYPQLQFHTDGPLPLLVNQDTFGNPCTVFSPSHFESNNYLQQEQFFQPAVYCDSQHLPTPPVSASIPYAGRAPTQLNMDPNVEAFFASLANSDSLNTYIPPHSAPAHQASFNPHDTIIATDPHNDELAAWSEFESSAGRWFPPTPPDGSYGAPPLSAPAHITTFGFNNSSNSLYLPSSLSRAPRYSAGNIYVDGTNGGYSMPTAQWPEAAAEDEAKVYSMDTSLSNHGYVEVQTGQDRAGETQGYAY